MPCISVSKLLPTMLHCFLAHGPFIRDSRCMIKKDLSRLIIKAQSRMGGGHLKDEDLGARFNSWARIATGLTGQGRKPVFPNSCLECLLLNGDLERAEANTGEGWSSWANASDQPEASYRLLRSRYGNVSPMSVNKCWKETTGAESAWMCEETTMTWGPGQRSQTQQDWDTYLPSWGPP